MGRPADFQCVLEANRLIDDAKQRILRFEPGKDTGVIWRLIDAAGLLMMVAGEDSHETDRGFILTNPPIVKEG